MSPYPIRVVEPEAKGGDTRTSRWKTIALILGVIVVLSLVTVPMGAFAQSGYVRDSYGNFVEVDSTYNANGGVATWSVGAASVGINFGGSGASGGIQVCYFCVTGVQTTVTYWLNGAKYTKTSTAVYAPYTRYYSSGSISLPAKVNNVTVVCKATFKPSAPPIGMLVILWNQFFKQSTVSASIFLP
jgi:hypothetical protein